MRVRVAANATARSVCARLDGLVQIVPRVLILHGVEAMVAVFSLYIGATIPRIFGCSWRRRPWAGLALFLDPILRMVWLMAMLG